MAAEKSSPELLPDQAAREAAQTCLDVSFLLEAGAGSGKTRALVDRYLSILDNDEQADVENIVAITFTRKAAREMKERIRAELVARMATAGDDDLRRLRERIRKLETAPICTIHSFCASILEQYPFAAELDPRFTLLDETQTDVNLPRVVEDSLLSRLSSDSEQDSNTAARVISYFGGLPKAGDAIVELLYKRSQYYDYLCAPPSAEEIGRSWEERERQFYGPIREQFVSELRAQDLVSRISAAAEIARAIPDSDHLAKQVLRVHYLLQDGPPLHSDGLADFRTEILNATKNINMGRQDNWGGREKIEQARRAMAAVRELAQNLLGELNTLATQYSEETVEVAAAIWAEAAAALQAWRDFEATIPALDFEDVQIRLRDLLRSDAEVRRALQTRFRHILVDEFQDTDGLQRDLVWLLAGLQQGVEGNGRVFVVGDAKQSIYRFRNADVKVFTDACRQFEEDSGARRERLTATFRAHSGLVDFFNALFCNPGVMGSTATERFEVAYEPMQALREPIGDGPWVFGMLALARPGEASVLQRVAEAELIARTVRQLLDAAPPVYDHGSSSYRTLGPGDVAILFRAATDVHIYEEELEKLGVPYYNAAGRGFYTRPEVADLINLAKAVANPDDAIALVSVLRSPMFALSDATLFWLAQARGTWWDRLTDAPGAISSGREPYCHVAAEEHERLRLAADLFSQWRAVYDRVPVSSLLEAAVEQTGYSAAMAALPAGERRVANIHKLLDYARDFDRAGRGGLMAFAEELMLLAKQNAKEEQAPTEEEHGDSVRLSTVHGAKGLQWPVVIVADLNRREVTGTSSLTRMHPEYGIVPAEVGAQPERLWRLIGEVVKRANDAEEAAENKRLLYVALTRASEILIMSSGLGMGDENKLEAPAKDSWLGRLLDGCGVTLPDKLDCSAEGQLTPVSAAEGLCPWFVVPRDAEFRLSWLQNLPRTARQEPEAEETLQPPVDLSAALARIPPDTGARRRFTVTELARYLQCPRYYWLRYVEGLPDCACPPGISRAGMSALEIGNLAHHLLRMVGTGGSQALDNLLRPVLPGGRQVKFLDDRTRETLRSLLEWYLEHRFYEENLVGARLRTEAPLTFPLDRALIEGKVDAVAEKNGDLVVIDYKTGLASESEQGELEDEGTVDADRFQVALYSYGLYTVTGRWPREAVVVYLRQPGRFEHVSLPREGLEAAERAGQAVAEITGQLRGLPPPRVEYGCSGCGLGWACEDREVSTRRGV